MLKRIVLMDSISSNLYSFLKKISKHLSVLDKILLLLKPFIRVLSLRAIAACWWRTGDLTDGSRSRIGWIINTVSFLDLPESISQ